MVKKIYSGLILLLLFASLSLAQEVKVKAFVDAATYEVGDFINYSIDVIHDENVTVYSPSIKDSLKGVELLKVLPSSEEKKDNKVVSTFKFLLSKYDSGDVFIPAIPVAYSSKGSKGKSTLLTNTVSFTVHTLAVDQRAEIKDIKEPIKIPLDWRLILLFVVIGILLIVAGYYGYKYYRKKRALKLGIIEEIKKEPHEAALEELTLLEAKQLWQKGLIKEYHTEVTEIIRRYFEGRFKVPALELTTGEVIENLKKVKDASEVLQITSNFLNNADMVKFAKFIPMNDINEEMMKQAYEIVNTTIPKQEPLPEPEPVVPDEEVKNV